MLSIRKLGSTVLGLVVTLVWWSIHDSGSDTATAAKIPVRVWNGDAGAVVVEVETSVAAQMRASFYEDETGMNEDARSLETWEDIGVGTRTWSIGVPARVGGTLELSAVDPEPGAQLRWRILVNGEVVREETETLEQALAPGYGFFLQAEFDDYASATSLD